MSLTIAEWAEEFAWLPEEENAAPGKFRLSRMPHQEAMLDDPAAHGVRKVAWMLASQVGKTLALILLAEYAIKVARRSIIMSRPTKDLALEWMRTKFEPTLESTPAMAGLLIEPRKRDSKSTKLHRKFPGGSFRCVGAMSPAAFRSASAGILLKDEMDSYRVTKEGDPCALLDRALTTFGNSWNVESSTPTLKGASKIEATFLEGDQQRYFVPCPLCGTMQWLRLEQLKFTFTAEEHARTCHPSDAQWTLGKYSICDPRRALYVCQECRRGWTDEQRLAAYLSGHKDNPAVKVAGQELRAAWRPTEVMEDGSVSDVRKSPFNGIRSRHLSGMYLTIGLKTDAHANYLHRFADEFLEAKRGGREALMVYTNLKRADTYEDPHEKLDWKSLADRAEDYNGQVLPPQVVWIDFGADVQQDRLEILSYGWGADQECWALDYQVIYGDFDLPGMQERVADYLLNKRFTHPILGELTYSAGGVDSGHQTKVQAVYQFCGKHRLNNIYSVKGFDSSLGALYQRETERRFGGLRFNLNTDTFKSTVFTRLANKTPGPRYIHFPKSVVNGKDTRFDEVFYSGLCSERRVPVRDKKNNIVWHWRKHTSSTRNEPLDMTVYAFGIHAVARQDEWIARKWREVSEKLKELEPPVPRDRMHLDLPIETDEKLPELKVQPTKAIVPRRRVVRVNSPFARRF